MMTVQSKLSLTFLFWPGLCVHNYFSVLQVPKEAGTDLLCFPKPGWDEWRGRSAIQLTAHTEEAYPERRLRGEQQHSWMNVD